MPDAARSMRNDRLTVEHFEHAFFGAGSHAAPASRTPREVDLGVLQPSRVTSALPRVANLLSAQLHCPSFGAVYEPSTDRKGQKENEENEKSDAHCAKVAFQRRTDTAETSLTRQQACHAMGEARGSREDGQSPRVVQNMEFDSTERKRSVVPNTRRRVRRQDETRRHFRANGVTLRRQL